MNAAGQVRVGVGGWSFAPWRGRFYPLGLPQKQELAFASRALSAIEINATFYKTQTRDSFRRWADQTPDDFQFTVKAHRLTTHRTRLAENGPAVGRFLASGVTALERRLGPILWQFAPTKKFEAEDFEAFLSLLPHEADGFGLRHALEVRHPSFCTEAFVALARRYRCAICYARSDAYPEIADQTGDFVYARLQTSSAATADGYPAGEIQRWRDRIERWAAGDEPDDLPRLGTRAGAGTARDVFVFFIAGAKEKNPAAARALIKSLGGA